MIYMMMYARLQLSQSVLTIPQNCVVPIICHSRMANNRENANNRDSARCLKNSTKYEVSIQIKAFKNKATKLMTRLACGRFFLFMFVSNMVYPTMVYPTMVYDTIPHHTIHHGNGNGTTLAVRLTTGAGTMTLALDRR